MWTSNVITQKAAGKVEKRRGGGGQVFNVGLQWEENRIPDVPLPYPSSSHSTTVSQHLIFYFYFLHELRENQSLEEFCFFSSLFTEIKPTLKAYIFSWWPNRMAQPHWCCTTSSPSWRHQKSLLYSKGEQLGTIHLVFSFSVLMKVVVNAKKVYFALTENTGSLTGSPKLLSKPRGL